MYYVKSLSEYGISQIFKAQTPELDTDTPEMEAAEEEMREHLKPLAGMPGDEALEESIFNYAGLCIIRGFTVGFRKAVEVAEQVLAQPGGAEVDASAKRVWETIQKQGDV